MQLLKKFYLIHLSKVIICYTALWMSYKSYEFRYVSDFFVLNTYCKYCKLIWNISSMFTLRYKHIWLQRCVYTHSLYLWNLLKAFYRLGCPVAQASLPACHPVCQRSAQSANCPRLPRAIQAKTTSSWFRFQFFGGQHRHTYFAIVA